jgi:hypothetical protein
MEQNLADEKIIPHSSPAEIHPNSRLSFKQALNVLNESLEKFSQIISSDVGNVELPSGIYAEIICKIFSIFSLFFTFFMC